MRHVLADRDSAVGVACGGAAAAAGLASMFASQDGSFSPTALVHISSTEPLARVASQSDAHFHFVSAVQHYDGAYYFAMARDPLLIGGAHKLIDQPAYRYGHPLHGWLAGLLSLGQAGNVPFALLLLSLIGLAVGGWAVSRLACQFGRSPWGGLLIATSPGLLYAASVDTTETVGAALIALAFLAWARERYLLAAVVIALACLDKEQYITVPLGLLVWEGVGWWRSRERPAQLDRKVIAIITGPV
ncbi:MAG: AZOBR_p60025 family cell surface glycopolymer formation protein, partial [Mycobacteriales bacterium]